MNRGEIRVNGKTMLRMKKSEGRSEWKTVWYIGQEEREG